MARKLKPLVAFVKEVIHEFNEDRGSLFAAAISFFGLISLIPLLLLAIGVFGYIIGSEEAFRRVVSFAMDFIPAGTEELEANLRAISAGSGLLSGLGFIGLLWTGSQVFVIIQQVMNIALGNSRRIGFLHARTVAVGMVLITGVLFTLSLGITSLLAAIRDFDVRFWGIGPKDLEAIWHFLGVLLPILISILAFAFIYKFLPLREIGITAPAIGGVTAGLLFEAAKYAFRWYVLNIANFSRIYGSLGSIVVIVVWIYYVSLITVLGAEVASVYARRQRGR